MQPDAVKSGSRSVTLLLGSLAAVLVLVIIFFPDLAFQSSLEGLTIWWKLVFPALMPFFILSELLIGFGVIHGIGILLEPLMRLIFRLPGVSGWALSSGFIVGFPTGAKITAVLREKGLLSRLEAQRLSAVSHLCSPLFLLTVVGVGFLHNARLGLLLAIIHYISALAAGLILALKDRRDPEAGARRESDKQPANASDPIGKRALDAMRTAYLEDGRTFGKLLGDSVISSVQTLMLIGGYMMIFSVIINVVTIARLTDVIRLVTAVLPDSLQIGTDLAPQWVKGLFEIHLGAYAFSQGQDIPLLWQMSLLSGFLAWGGLSAHAQVAGLQQKTDVRYGSFLLSRLLHAALAFLCTFMLWKPLGLLLRDVEPSFLWLDKIASPERTNQLPFINGSPWSYWLPLLSQVTLLISVMILVSLFIQSIKSQRSN